MKQLRWALLFATVVAAAPASRADTLDDVRQRGVLRWGGDEEGGAPYILAGDDKTRPAGFEGELMEQLARRVGARPEFKQCQWDNLPDLLRSGETDIIINGIELRADRLRQYICTIPYYVNDLQLLTRKDDARVTGWIDLHRTPAGSKWRIGVLADTAAQKYLADNFPDDVDAIAYPGTTQAMDHVRDRQLDATLTDLMAARTYLPRYPNLHAVGETVGRGYFVIYLRPGDPRLRDELNARLREMLADGRLKAIYDRYQIWNAAQESLGSPDVQAIPETMRATDQPPANRQLLVGALPDLLEAAGMTILLSVLSMPLAMVAGLLVAIGRLYSPAALRAVLTAYVEVIRGTPLAMQLFLLYYVLPSVVPLPDWHWLRQNFAYLAAVGGLALNYSAYEAEIYRAGLLAIPAGQLEAALALGMSRRQALAHVLVPQAVRLVVPPVTSDFIALFKDTAVCQVITIIELSKRYQILANNTGLVLQFAAVTAGLYLLMSLPLVLLSRRLERGRARINV
ncbi:MAG: ABC transporter substrate-binding protein/permease [Gemmataceae bacterium]